MAAMIRFVTADDLREYEQAGSPFAALLPDDPPAKQMIAWKLYGDLLGMEGWYDILDVGCGSSPLTERMRKHWYVACDLSEDFDWRDINSDAEHDLVIANDLFPNVDQGLADFLARWYGKAELRLSLTVYDNRYYRAKRVDGDEVLTVRAWDWPQTAACLAGFGVDGILVAPPKESLFPNGRQVCLAIL